MRALPKFVTHLRISIEKPALCKPRNRRRTQRKFLQSFRLQPIQELQQACECVLRSAKGVRLFAGKDTSLGLHQKLQDYLQRGGDRAEPQKQRAELGSACNARLEHYDARPTGSALRPGRQRDSPRTPLLCSQKQSKNSTPGTPGQEEVQGLERRNPCAEEAFQEPRFWKLCGQKAQAGRAGSPCPCSSPGS